MHLPTKALPTLLAIGACLAGSQALAQAWPAKQVRIIVAAPAGSAPDIAARAIADKLAVTWGQQPIVDNKPGAGCGIAMDAARSAPADGYTLVMPQAACVVVSPLTFKTFKADIDRDFTTVSIVGVTPMLIVANNAAPAKTLAEIVAQAKANPDKVSMGNPARTSIPHLASELIAQQTGAKIFQVSFGSSGQATTAAIAGDVLYGLDGVAAMQPMVKAGKLRAIAVTADKVLPGLEGYPLAKDAVPGLEVFGWFAMMAPKATPAAVALKMNEDISKALVQPDVVARFAGFGTYPRPGSLQDAAAFIKKEQAVWAKVIKDAGIQAE
jgi:tripartite-type tricarboxylate transporter receptor subunit TctC